MASEVLKAWEACDKTDTLFVLVCTVICWTIVPTVRSLPSPPSHREYAPSDLSIQLQPILGTDAGSGTFRLGLPMEATRGSGTD